VTFTALGDHLAITLPGGTALFTTRRGGVSTGPFASLNLGLKTDDVAENVRENRARVERLTGGRLAAVRQVHGTDVVEADPDTLADADGQVTTRRGVAAIALVADCLPIALVAPEGVGMIHAGWRGLAGGVLEATIDAMGTPAGKLYAWLGPAIGPRVYEVGEDVRAAIGEPRGAFMPTRPGHWLLDLYAVARARLATMGVRRIYGGGYCTFTERERFFSYRRDHDQRRMAAAVWLESSTP
jgi:polyphenol oxidase